MEVVTLIQGSEESHLIPLFFVHAISGLALPFLRLESLGDGDRPLYGITSPLHCYDHEDFVFPSTLRALAERYVQEVTSIQPCGPYLLGGWSMGGMVAMNMAHILQSRGEKILKVIMVDSGNPEAFPTFSNKTDNDALARVIFMRALAPPSVEPSRQSTIWKNLGVDENDPVENQTDDWPSTYTESSASSVVGFGERPPWTRVSSLSLQDSSAEGSDCDSVWDKADDLNTDTPDSDSDSDSSSDVDDADCDEGKRFLDNIKLHVRKGLQLIANVQPGDLLPRNARSDFHAVLIKCKSVLPSDYSSRDLVDSCGAQAIRDIMREDAMRWDASRFARFDVLPFSGDHDSAFEPEFVGELSGILRGCLEGTG